MELIDDDVGFVESVETILVLLDLDRNLVTLILQLAQEDLHEGQIRGRSHVVVPAKLVVEVLRLISDTHVESDGALGEDVKLIAHLKLVSLLLILAVSNREESILGPRVIPVDRRTVDNRRELTAAVTERVADRRERQHNMHVLTTKLDEVSVDVFASLLDTGSFSLVKEFIIDLGSVFRSEQVWNLAGVEQVVDVFKEGFEDDLGVREKELDLLTLETAHFEEVSDVLMPVFLRV